MCRVSVPASIPQEASFPGFAGTEIQAHGFPRLDTVSASHTSTMVTRSLFNRVGGEGHPMSEDMLA